ncbi:MAG: hypothetical protein Alpg2KO_11230 [Alphaproteobacteria bacterium]
MKADPRRILKSKTDIPREEIDEMSLAEAWKIVYGLPKPPKKPKIRNGVCVTGFSLSEKQEVEAEAINAGYTITKSVTKGTIILICGENAGPKKIEKAEAAGIEVIDYEEFHDMIKRGKE